MPAPFSPDPADLLSAATPRPSPSTEKTASVDPEASTPFVAPAANDDLPTVISLGRPKSSFDSQIGEALAGRTLGPFELIESVGAGGMAAVIKARDRDLGRIVALKILPPDMAADPDNVNRFRQEGRAAAKLDHENVARAYHCGEDQGLYFIAFEFVEGENLRQLMEANGGTLPVAESVSILIQVSAGLAHAAERGIVHRDIKPSNIVVTPDGRVKIVDMGLARSLDNRAGGQLTQSGVTLGTFDYISPEQAIEPRSADVRSDIYSLGCTFYHALTGHVPVPEGTAAKKLDAHKNILPPDPRSYNPAIPAALAAILGRMMAKDPALRYQHPDHLIAHLRQVAKSLGLATGPLPAAARAYDDPLPPAPRLSWAWITTALTVMVLAIVVFTNTPDRPPVPRGPNATGKEAAKAAPVDLGPAPAKDPIASGPRDAADVGEFVALLKQGIRHIRLTGSEYDLTRYRDADNQAIEAAFNGSEVLIEGVVQPTVKLAFAPAGLSRPRAITLKGDGTGKASIRGVRFVLPLTNGDADSAGLMVSGFTRVSLEECTFSTAFRTNRDGPAAIAVTLGGGSATFVKCYFAPGCVGMAVEGPGKMTATECALAPQHAVVRVRRAAGGSGDTDLTFSNCSALLSSGALVEIGDGVPCAVRAGHCLFGGRAAFGPFDPVTALIRQRGGRAIGTKYEALLRAADREALPNAYDNVLAYDERDTGYSFADCAREGLPFRDADRPPIKHPWKEPDPFALLAADKAGEAKRAFVQDPRQAVLRVKANPNREVIGTRFLGPEQLYSLPLPSPEPEARDLTTKVWDPSLSTADVQAGIYPTLTTAIAAARRGDTILIRHTGRLEVNPTEFETDETNLTIKPEGTSRPLLVPAAATLKKPTAMFKLYGGRLVLDGLHFRLSAGRAPAVAALPGGGQIEIRNAVITFDDGIDLAAVALTDPKDEMMAGATTDRGPSPKVWVENVVLRGRGRLLAVRRSRPFELEMKNAVAVLDGPLIDIDASATDLAGAGSGVVKLTRVTTCVSGGLLHLKAAERKADMGPLGLARTEVTATSCLFAPPLNAADAFVRVDRVDTLPQVERLLSWRGSNNVYAYDKKKVMMDVRPADQEAMPLKSIDGDRWLLFTQEEGDPFFRVGFATSPPQSERSAAFGVARPGDFLVRNFEPARPTLAADCGAPLNLPQPFDE